MRRYSGIAQSVEHLTVNQGVTGSSPVAGARISAVFADFLFALKGDKYEKIHYPAGGRFSGERKTTN